MPDRVVETRSRKLRILQAELEDKLGQGIDGAAPAVPERLPPKPDWIRMKMPAGEKFFDLKKRVAELGLHTVCESASCPNIGECWNRQSLTIMILGGVCGRASSATCRPDARCRRTRRSPSTWR
jgi:lipoate synthase